MTARRRRVAGWLVGLAALYAAGNILVPIVIPGGFRCTMAVRVVDAATNRPVAGALVTLDERTATTDASGGATLTVTSMERPAWVLPRLGRYRFRGWPPLRVEAAGFEPAEQDLGALDLPLSPEVSFTLRLTPGR